MNGVDRNTDHDLYIAIGKTCQYYGMALCKCKQDFSAFDHALQANPELLQLHGVFLTSLHSLTSLLWLLCASTEIEAAWFQNMGPRLPWHCVIPGCFCLQHPATSRETEGKRKIHISIYIYISIIHDRYYKCNWKSIGDLPSGTACPTPFKGGRRHQGASPFYKYIQIHILIYIYTLCHIYVHQCPCPPQNPRLGGLRAESRQNALSRGVLHRGMEPLDPRAQHVDVWHR